jgi:uncharacterized protein (DUF427 family)
MGLSWQQGPLSPGAIGRFLVPESLPKRLLYAEPLRRRMRVRFGGTWIADSETVLVLFEPGRYPVAYFPKADISIDSLQRTEHTTRHSDLGLTSWYAVQSGEKTARRGAWQHMDLSTRVSSGSGSRSPGRPWTPSTKKTSGSWGTPLTATTASTSARPRAASSFAIETASSQIQNGRWFATSPAFAPRWYVTRADIDESALGITQFGGVAALYDLARELQLVELIDQHVPKRRQGPSVGQYILVAAINRCVAPTSKLRMPEWLTQTPLPRWLGLPPKHFSSPRFWDNMDLLREAQIDAIAKALTPRLMDTFHLDPACLLFDCTNFDTFIDTENDSQLPQRGHAKSKRTAAHCRARSAGHLRFSRAAVLESLPGQSARQCDVL